MSNDPAFLFYSQDFIIGTQFFSNEQVGKYVRLLCAQHQHGHLSIEQVNYICSTYDDSIMSKFLKDEDGKFFNQRLDQEVNKRKSFCNSRKENIKKRYKVQVNNTCTTHVVQVENENENENENKDIKEKVSEFVKLTSIEHGKLNQEFGEEITRLSIEKLNAYKGSTGKKYKSDYLAIRNWVVKQVKKDINELNGNIKPNFDDKARAFINKLAQQDQESQSNDKSFTVHPAEIR